MEAFVVVEKGTRSFSLYIDQVLKDVGWKSYPAMKKKPERHAERRGGANRSLVSSLSTRTKIFNLKKLYCFEVN